MGGCGTRDSLFLAETYGKASSLMRYILPDNELLFIDGERTYPMGEDGQRRWMELAIIDGAGATVFHSYFNPGIPVDGRFAKKGLTDAVLVERKELTSGSTWHAAGLLPLFNMSYSVGQLHKYAPSPCPALDKATG